MLLPLRCVLARLRKNIFYIWNWNALSAFGFRIEIEIEIENKVPCSTSRIAGRADGTGTAGIQRGSVVSKQIGWCRVSNFSSPYIYIKTKKQKTKKKPHIAHWRSSHRHKLQPALYNHLLCRSLILIAYNVGYHVRNRQPKEQPAPTSTCIWKWKCPPITPR
jgi:hypothetical protein